MNGCNITGDYDLGHDDLFEPACDEHDKAYQILGTNKHQVDEALEADISQLCQKLNPIEAAACLLEVPLYDEALNTSISQDIFESEQQKSENYILSQDVFGKHIDKTCVSLLGNLDRVGNSVEQELNISFSQVTGRYPTTNEEFELLNGVSNFNNWKSNLASRISSGNYSTVNLPNAAYLMKSNKDPLGNITSVYLDAAIASTGSGLSYAWYVNNKKVHSSKFTGNVVASGYKYFDGYLRVTDNAGNVDYKFIDTKIYVQVNNAGMEP